MESEIKAEYIENGQIVDSDDQIIKNHLQQQSDVDKENINPNNKPNNSEPSELKFEICK